MKTIIFFILLVCLTGCASFWSGSLNSNLAIPPEKYHYVQTVSGEASTFLLFGVIGGLHHKNLIQEARQNLLSRYRTSVGANQVLANWSLTMEKRVFFFATQQRCIVTADLISLTPLPPQVLEKTPLPDSEIRAFLDSAYVKVYGETYKGSVIQVNKKTLKITYSTKSGKIFTQRFRKSDVVILPRAR